MKKLAIIFSILFSTNAFAFGSAKPAPVPVKPKPVQAKPADVVKPVVSSIAKPVSEALVTNKAKPIAETKPSAGIPKVEKQVTKSKPKKLAKKKESESKPPQAAVGSKKEVETKKQDNQSKEYSVKSSENNQTEEKAVDLFAKFKASVQQPVTESVCSGARKAMNQC